MGLFLKHGKQKVGNYDVDTTNLLGRGGFGEVFSGVNKDTGDPIAAKRVWMKRADAIAIAEVMQEVSALQKIKHHENIVQFYESRREKDCLWIFIEFCEHGNLNSYFVQRKVELKQKLDIAYQCLLAIDHLHGQKPPIVHRDIKPGNILIKHQNGRVVIKITDFGLAKINSTYLGAAWAMRTLCGTEAFMAPEQFAIQATGTGNYDKSVDVYAMGLVMASLVETQPGYNLEALEVNGRPIGLVMWRLHEDGHKVWSPIKFSMKEVRHVREAKTLISMMMSYDPKERPTAGDVMQELKSIIDSLPSAAHLPVKLQIDDDFSENITCHSDPEEPTVIERRGEFPRKRRSPKRTTIRRRPTPAKNNFKGPDIRGTIHILSKQTMQASTGKTPKYVIVGGLAGSEAKISNMCWVLETNPDGFLWQGLTEVPEDMCLFNAAVCQVDPDSFVVMGGGNGSDVTSRCYLYTASVDKWTRLPDMSAGRCGAAVLEYEGDLFVMGGEGKDNKILGTCEHLDISKRSWEADAEMLQPMLLPIAASTHDGVYALFNTHPDNRAIQKTRGITLQHYDPDTKTWSYKAPMLSQIYDTLGASAVPVSQMIYFVGGWDKMCAQYNCLTDMWTLLKNSLAVHVYNSAVHFRHKITMFGGAGANGPSVVIEEYDIEKNTWRNRTLELPEPLHFHHAVILNL